MTLGPRATRLLLGAIAAAAIAPRPGAAADGGPDVPASVPVPVPASASASAPAVEVASSAALSLPRPTPPPSPIDLDPRRTAPEHGLLAGGGLAVPIGETLATTGIIMEWNRTVGSAPWADVSSASIGRNLRSGWVLDDDGFWVNQFAHPYQGTFSFTAARTSGIGFWGSAPFTIGASALWEVVGETTPPAWNDQVTTSVAGMVFGEILYRFAGALRAEGGGWNTLLASVLCPMGAVNKELLGTPQALRAPAPRYQLALGGAAYSGPALWSGEPRAYGALSFTYGVPGSPGLELDRPFDHFALDVSWTAAADPAATVMARGLLAGAAFDGSAARGLYGAYLSFDFDTPPGHRVSTSAIGFGGSARADLLPGLALEGDAVASAVLLGAAGSIPRVPGGAGRDYQWGSGEQALLGVRLLAGSRFTTGLELRQYLLLGVGSGNGTEQALHATAHASIRLFGANGIGVEVSRYLRWADVAGASVSQADSAVRLYLDVRGGA